MYGRCTLQLEHTLAYTVHKEALLNDEENEQQVSTFSLFLLSNYFRIYCIHFSMICFALYQLNHSDNYYNSLGPVICARDFYLQQRQYLWKILQELIRISLDDRHAYNVVSADYVKTLCDR